jgi:hypothetical protein
MKFSKKIVSLIVILNVLFTIGVLVVFWHTGSEPSSLVVAWFGSFTAELWIISGIKKKKIEKEKQDEI